MRQAEPIANRARDSQTGRRAHHAARSCGRRLWHSISGAALLLLAAAPCDAYTVQTPITEGCHERVTIEAWRGAREQAPELTQPLTPQEDDAALIDDVAFDVPRSLRSIGPVSLLLAVRYPDLKGYGPRDLQNLEPVAARPENQREHCLRAPDQDEPDGSQAALSDCREFIREQLLAALDGLDAEGKPEGSTREKLPVTLAIRGEMEVSLPTFFVHAGRALHALQDSFTHTFRRPDAPKKVTVVINYTEYVEHRLDETVDGPPHLNELDRCDDPDELRTQRRLLAVEASQAALLALLGPADRASKEEAIERVLDEYMSFDADSDCHAENDWCDAPELAYRSEGCGCRAAAAPAGSRHWLASALCCAGVALGRRKRRRRPRQGARQRRKQRAAAVLTALPILLAISPARAQQQAQASTTTLDETSPPAADIDRAGALFWRIAGGVSYDNAALAGATGIRYQLNRNWMVGFDVEWNPYIAVTPGKVRPGSLNTYGSLIRRFQLRASHLNVRTTLSLGASMLLFDLVGADKYDWGPFGAISLLGAEWEFARGAYLTIDPTLIALPVPHVTGIPFLYKQYRFVVGLELGGN